MAHIFKGTFQSDILTHKQHREKAISCVTNYLLGKYVGYYVGLEAVGNFFFVS